MGPRGSRGTFHVVLQRRFVLKFLSNWSSLVSSASPAEPAGRQLSNYSSHQLAVHLVQEQEQKHLPGRFLHLLQKLGDSTLQPANTKWEV